MDYMVFGYGSLVLQTDAERTVAGITYLFNAQLPGHRVMCTRFARSRDGGVADVVPDASSCVWGAVYQVNEAGLAKLDSREGVYVSAYQRDQIVVYKNGDQATPVNVEIYTVVMKSDRAIPCTCEYRDLIIAGAKQRGFPSDYISILHAIPVKEAE